MILEEKIITTISETLGMEKETISLNSNFLDDLNASEVELADLFLKVQQVCGVEIEEENFKNIKTVANLINLIQENSDEL